MNYARSNNVSGSESSDSEHNEGKKDGNACENVDNIYRDTNGNIVDHDWKLLPPIPNNHLLSLSEPHIGKGKPDIMGQNIIVIVTRRGRILSGQSFSKARSYRERESGKVGK